MDIHRPLLKLLRGFYVPGGQQSATGHMDPDVQPVVNVDAYEPWPTYQRSALITAIGNFQHIGFFPGANPIRNLKLWLGQTGAGGYKLWVDDANIPVSYAFGPVPLTDAGINSGRAARVQVLWGSGAAVAPVHNLLIGTANDIELSISNMDCSAYLSRGVQIENAVITNPINVSFTWEEMPSVKP